MKINAIPLNFNGNNSDNNTHITGPNEKAKQAINILSEDGTLLQSFPVEAIKGFNYANYDLSITKSGKKALMKENTKLDIRKAQNEKYYLPKGIYTVQIGSITKKLKIE